MFAFLFPGYFDYVRTLGQAPSFLGVDLLGSISAAALSGS